MNTADINDALRKRFCAPEWALFFEVANGTGSAIRNYADAIAMNLYPSRGLRINGFEVKVSRGDWQKELANPAKAEAIMRYCDHWWIVTPKGLVRDGELPPTWGLYEVDGRGMTCKVQAPALTAEPLTRAFVAAMVRRAGQADAAAVNKQAEKMVADRTRWHGEELKRVREESNRRADGYAGIIAALEEASGMKLDRYIDVPGLARAAALVHKMGILSTYGTLQGLANRMRQTVKEIDDALPEMRSLGDDHL